MSNEHQLSSKLHAPGDTDDTRGHYRALFLTPPSAAPVQRGLSRGKLHRRGSHPDAANLLARRCTKRMAWVPCLTE